MMAFICPECGRNFSSKRGVSCHRASVHKVYSGVRDTRPRTVPCYICGKMMLNEIGMGVHLFKMHGIRKPPKPKTEPKLKPKRDQKPNPKPKRVKIVKPKRIIIQRRERRCHKPPYTDSEIEEFERISNRNLLGFFKLEDMSSNNRKKLQEYGLIEYTYSRGYKNKRARTISLTNKGKALLAEA